MWISSLIRDPREVPWVAIFEVVAEALGGAYQAVAAGDSTIEVAVWAAARPIHPLFSVDEKVPGNGVRLVHLVLVLQVLIQVPRLEFFPTDTTLDRSAMPLLRANQALLPLGIRSV